MDVVVGEVGAPGEKAAGDAVWIGASRSVGPKGSTAALVRHNYGAVRRAATHQAVEMSLSHVPRRSSLSRLAANSLVPSTQRGDCAASDRAQPTRKEDGASRRRSAPGIAPWRTNHSKAGSPWLPAPAVAGAGIAVEFGAAGATVHFVPEVQDAGKS